MGIRKYKKQSRVTFAKLRHVVLDFLTKHEATLVADYKPEEEQWRKILASALAQQIYLTLTGEMDEQTGDVRKDRRTKCRAESKEAEEQATKDQA